jgi:hypothetical protein
MLTDGNPAQRGGNLDEREIGSASTYIDHEHETYAFENARDLGPMARREIIERGLRSR